MDKTPDRKLELISQIVAREKDYSPQGLKPGIDAALDGTTEVVPSRNHLR